MLAKTVLVIALAVAVTAQIPARCATPKAWTGRTSTWDHGANRHDRGFIAYDASNERVRFTDDVNAFAPGRTFYEHIVNYREKVSFNINLSTKTCKKEAIPAKYSWHAFGIPTNATYDDEITIGAGANVITASEWSMPAYDHPKGWMWYGSFSLVSCVPIREVIAVNVSSAMTREFFDITLGVDPNDFTPPDYCPN